MKKLSHGPALYYVSDKNIFDALNQTKVDSSTLASMLERRNTLIGKGTARERTAQYFARLTHDFYDHQAIADRLGIIAKRERITSQAVVGVLTVEDIQAAASTLRSDLETMGDVVQLARNGDDLTVTIQYSVVDYKRNEFAQIQVRDGLISFLKTDDGYVVRNTQNDYCNAAVDAALTELQKAKGSSISRVAISLFDVVSPKLRSRFFHELATKLPGYSQRDVTDVYVYKLKPTANKDNDGAAASSEENDTHIERVLLRGNGVTRSELLNGLLDEDDYYIVKIGWMTKEVLAGGDTYSLEALFTDANNCSGFSFIVSSVHELYDGKTSSRGRAPRRDEVEKLSKVIEAKARSLVNDLRSEAVKNATGL